MLLMMGGFAGSSRACCAAVAACLLHCHVSLPALPGAELPSCLHCCPCAVIDICRAAEEVFDHSNHFEHLASVRAALHSKPCMHVSWGAPLTGSCASRA